AARSHGCKLFVKLNRAKGRERRVAESVVHQELFALLPERLKLRSVADGEKLHPFVEQFERGIPYYSIRADVESAHVVFRIELDHVLNDVLGELPAERRIGGPQVRALKVGHRSTESPLRCAAPAAQIAHGPTRIHDV